MARLLCESNINFTDASWKVIHPTGYSMSEAASTLIPVAITATYNGANDSVKLTLRSNAAAGSSYDSDIVAASSTSASNGAWETLTYSLPSNVTDDTSLEFWIECVGTAGFVNFDTIVVT